MVKNCLNCLFSFVSFRQKIEPIIDKLDLEPNEKKIIMERYVREVVLFEKKHKQISFFYLIFSFYITIGGVLISSLLILEKTSLIPVVGATILTWITWTISLLISVANKCIDRFNLDKKYILNTRDLEIFKSEGWQYIGLGGRYRRYATHKEAFKPFINKIEHLKIKNAFQNIDYTSGEEPAPKYKFTSDSSLSSSGEIV